jgi:bacillithiol biosynthesis cysteine-adding enzyme BshC
MNHSRIAFSDTGLQSRLIQDYIEEAESLADCYGLAPKFSNIPQQITRRQTAPLNREVLVTALMKQYEANGLVFSDELSARLRSSDCYTITTGHQLSLFTGPLYFIYKVREVIALAADLKQHYQEFDFLPVFWMATEDHDFEEINHFVVDDHKLTWERPSGGAVGRLDTTGLDLIALQLKEILGPGERALSLVKLFETAYLKQQNLAHATRVLVQTIFSGSDLVVLDGDDPALKQLALPIFHAELFEQKTVEASRAKVEMLNENYHAQAHVRDINLFYLTENARNRIVKEASGAYSVDSTDLSFSAASLETILQQHPERFSPNVLLRPIYQEQILPNLMYVGGGGEVAYWLQLKGVFEAFNLPMPMVKLRNSFLFLSKATVRRLGQLNLDLKDMFSDRHQLEYRLVEAASAIDLKLDPFREKLERLFADLHQIAELTDKSMLGAVAAQQQKQLKGMVNLEKKLLRAEKRRNADVLRRLDLVLAEVFPGGTFQERKINQAALVMQHDWEWLQDLVLTNPWDSALHVFYEDASI